MTINYIYNHSNYMYFLFIMHELQLIKHL